MLKTSKYILKKNIIAKNSNISVCKSIHKDKLLGIINNNNNNNNSNNNNKGDRKSLFNSKKEETKITSL